MYVCSSDKYFTMKEEKKESYKRRGKCEANGDRVTKVSRINEKKYSEEAVGAYTKGGWATKQPGYKDP